MRLVDVEPSFTAEFGAKIKKVQVKNFSVTCVVTIGYSQWNGLVWTWHILLIRTLCVQYMTAIAVS